jgi:hypothetical protein
MGQGGKPAGKAVLAALAALLLTLGLAACGGGSSPATSEAPTASKAEGESGAGKSDRGKGKSGSGGGEGGASQAGKESTEAAEFTPRAHSDSGGGSAQFEVKGGDNSIQEFGEEAGGGDFAAAAAALHGFLDARAEGNWAAACQRMAKSVVESFRQLASRAPGTEDKSCAAILEELINPAAKGAMRAEAARADVGSLRVEGDRSFVIYRGAGGTVLAMPMAEEGGAWKVASLAGTPLN